MAQLLFQGRDCLWKDIVVDGNRDKLPPSVKISLWHCRADPYHQWEDLCKYEKWRICQELGLEDPSANTELYKGGPYLDDAARESVRSQWVEQGIWDDEWDDLHGPGRAASWKHEIPFTQPLEQNASNNSGEEKGFSDSQLFGHDSGQVSKQPFGQGFGQNVVQDGGQNLPLFGADLHGLNSSKSDNHGTVVASLFGGASISWPEDKHTNKIDTASEAFSNLQSYYADSRPTHKGSRWGGLKVRSLVGRSPGSDAAKTVGDDPFRNPLDYSSLPAPDYSLETLARQVDSSKTKSNDELTRKYREFMKGLPFEEGRREQYARLIVDNPSSRLKLNYREAQLERDKEASRPIHQFNYQVARERDRIYQENVGDPKSVPQDVSTQAYEIVKNQWRVRHIWNEDWGILPGLYWVYEEDRYSRLVDEEQYDFRQLEDPASELDPEATGYLSWTKSRHRNPFSRNESKRKMQQSKRAKKKSKRNKRQPKSPKPWDEKMKAFDRLRAAEMGIALLRDDPRIPSDFGELGWMDEEKVEKLAQTGQWTDEEIRKNVKEMKRIWDGLPPWPADSAWRGTDWGDPLKVQMARLAHIWPEETIKFAVHRATQMGGYFGPTT